MLKPERHVMHNAVDKESRGRSYSVLRPAVDMLLYMLQVDVITHLVVVALQIKLRLFGVAPEVFGRKFRRVFRCSDFKDTGIPSKLCQDCIALESGMTSCR